MFTDDLFITTVTTVQVPQIYQYHYIEIIANVDIAVIFIILYFVTTIFKYIYTFLHLYYKTYI